MDSTTDLYQLFSSFILNQSKDMSIFRDLTAQGSVIQPMLPTMIKNLCQFMLDSNFAVKQVESPYSFFHFATLHEAQQSFPQLEVKAMLPHEVHRFMQSSNLDVIFDCKELGATVVTKEKGPLKTLTGATSLLLEPLFRYAFSDDLWSEDGKWPRFHARLVTLLKNKSLLIDSRGPGHYQLNLSAQKIENYGFKGLIQEDSYQLFLSWTFPLTILNELEKVISQEF